MTAPLETRRRAELIASLAEVRSRLADAATSVGRDPRELTLIAVTKTFPASDVAILAELGVLDIGENRDQEAKRKVAEVRQLLPEQSQRPRWHFVGQLQTNKARSVVGYASTVHSVDRPELVQALDAALTRAERAELAVFVQVNLDESTTGRGGARPDEVPALTEAVLATDTLRLQGVMTVAPQHEDPDRAFARLAEVAGTVRALAPQADAISAGMSEDFEQAVRHGATHLRIGSALLGHRTRSVR